MKFSLLAVLAAASTAPAVAEFYLKEQFNDDVSIAGGLRAIVDHAKVLVDHDHMALAGPHTVGTSLVHRSTWDRIKCDLTQSRRSRRIF